MELIKKKNKFFWHRIADLPGHNFRLPNHLAALGISQLSRLKRFNKKRRMIAKKYDIFLSKYSDIFKIQKVKKNLTHSYQMYSVQVKSKKRKSLLYYLKKNKIDASVHFDPPLNKMKYLRKYSRKLVNTDILSNEIITLPIYPNLKNRTGLKVNKV